MTTHQELGTLKKIYMDTDNIFDYTREWYTINTSQPWYIQNFGPRVTAGIDVTF